MELLTNHDLIFLCKRFNINLVQCDSKNKIKLKPDFNNPCCYIINLDNDTGSHWTGMFIYMGQCVYFDSYGKIMSNEIINFCQKYKLKLTYNKTQIQSYDSVLCGLKACAMLMLVCRRHKQSWLI